MLTGQSFVQPMALRRMTIEEYESIPADYRGVFTIHRTDISNWDQYKYKVLGKRTMLDSLNGVTTLFIEGQDFIIEE